MKIEIINQIFCIIPVQDSLSLIQCSNVKESGWSGSSLLRKVSLVRIQYGSPHSVDISLISFSYLLSTVLILINNFPII